MTNELIEKYIPKKYQSAVVDIYKDMDGWWIELSNDFISTSTETHTIHEYTLADLKKQFKTITKVEQPELVEQLELLKETKVSIIDCDTQDITDLVTVEEILEGSECYVDVINNEFVLLNVNIEDYDITPIGTTIIEALETLNKYTELFNNLDDDEESWESNFLHCVNYNEEPQPEPEPEPEPEPTPNLKTIYVKRQSKDNEVLLVTDTQFRTVNRLTNLTTGYIVDNTYYDGVIIVGVNSHSYNDTINEVLTRIDNRGEQQ